MRIAAVYDIHGNLPGLEAVLRDIDNADVDRLVVGGDIVPGPMPGEALACLRNLGIPVEFIHGNGERDALAVLSGASIEHVRQPFREAVRWSAREMQSVEDVLRSWPLTLRAYVPGLGDIFFCHATPHDVDEIFTTLTPEDRLAQLFDGIDADVVVCGHTHMQFDRRVGSIRIVNAGSTGMPFGAPGADWLLLGPGIEFRHTDYDLENAAARIRSTDYPQAENFAERNVLHPPSEQEMLELFMGATRTAGS